MSRKLFIGGNWKCNNSLAQTQALVGSLVDKIQFDPAKVEVIVAPVYLHLVTVLFTKKQPDVEVAAQNCSAHSFGAYTGEIAPEQLKDIAIKWVIIGHSERRTHFGQNDKTIADKVENALKHGLKVIFCFGETLTERQSNKTLQVITRQLDAIKEKVVSWDNIVLAYEPVWAIGTGKVATTEQVHEVHSEIRDYLSKISPEVAEKTRIIYGGSVTDTNCKQLIKVKDVDGFLVGGASLKPAFLDIVKSASQK